MNHALPLRSKIIIMASVMASLFLVALDQTIVATALGKIVEEFNSFSSLSWIVTAYLLTTTATVPIAGKLSDLFGRRTLLLVGVGIFALGSLLCGSAVSVEQLIAWRAVQGIGAGVITANAFTIIGDLFAPRERGRWQGMFGAVFGLSSVIGPLLGGWLTDGQTVGALTTDWRWTFLINIPIAVVAFGVIAYYCPRFTRTSKPHIDYTGAAILTFILGLTVLAVDNTEQVFSGVMDVLGIGVGILRLLLAVIIVAGLWLFIALEKRSNEPILPLSFFSNHNFVLIVATAGLFGAGFMGSILYLTQFNQQVFGAGPTESGLMLLPLIAGLMVSSIGSGQLISRSGHYKRFIVFGTSLSTAMVALLTTLTTTSSYSYEAVLMLALGFGLGMVLPVMNIAVQNEFVQSKIGVATSSLQLFRSLGATLGIALFGAILTAGVATNLEAKNIADSAYLQALSRSEAVNKIGSLSDTNTQITLNMPDVKQEITAGFTLNAQTLPVAERRQAEQSFAAKQQRYSDSVTTSLSDSLRLVFAISAGFMLLATILVSLLKERPLSTKANQGVAK